MEAPLEGAVRIQCVDEAIERTDVDGSVLRDVGRRSNCTPGSVSPEDVTVVDVDRVELLVVRADVQGPVCSERRG